MIFMEKSDWFPVKIFPTKPIHWVQGTKKHEETWRKKTTGWNLLLKQNKKRIFDEL